MEIREGYKKTEVGVIPQEWDVISFGDLFTFNGGLSASRDQLSMKGLCYLHYGDIHKSIKTYIDVTDEYSNLPKLNIAIQRVSNNALLNDGDVVFVDASEDDEGASKHIVIRNEKGIPFISGLHTIVSKSKTLLLDNRYREFCFQSECVKRQFKFYSAGTKVCGVSKGNIVKMMLPIPSLPKQQAIAAALSDIDGLISSITKLINKKRNIKQGAMQQLLTGKKRLDGFSGDWVETVLGSITKINTGKKNNEDKVDSGMYPFFVRSKQIEKIGTYSFDGEAIIVPGEGNIGEIFHYINGKFDFHQRVYKISDFSKEIHAKYIYFYIAKYFGEYALKNTVKATVDSLRLPTFKGFIVKLPPSLEEQITIANVLSDMDSEIESLEQKLNKYKGIKQGMMQELLTGRIRLVETAIQSHIIIKEAIIDKPKSNGHTKEFDEAIVVSAIVSRFATEQFPMGAFKRQKFAYLLHRYHENKAEGYGKFAAGPYNSHTKYGGAEKIAQSNKYVKEYSRENIKGFVVAEKCQQAIDYFNEWYGREVLEWLDQFQFVKKEEIELLATVDMAMVDLRQENKMVNVPGVKSIIQNSPEWKAKLNRAIFSDDNIKRAIEWSNRLFEN